MVKPFLMQFHRWLGVALGLILGIVAITGAIMSFEDEIAHVVDPALFSPGAPSSPDLTPDQLIAKVEAAHPGLHVDRIAWPVDRDQSIEIRLAPSGKGPRVEGQVDRATGQWLGTPSTDEFFATVRKLHRWLLLPDNGDGIGRSITGIAAIGLVILALSGLYLRWPYHARRWREWLVVDWQRKKRLFWRSLHVVTATWAIPFWLLSATTGLWWSYPSYRSMATQVLTGKPAKPEDRAVKPMDLSARPALDPVWQAIWRDKSGGYQSLRFAVPTGNVKKLMVEALPRDAGHARALDRFTYDLATVREIKADLYAKRSIGVAISQSMLELHRGAMMGLAGRLVILASTLILALAAVSGLVMFAYRQFKLGRKPRSDAAIPARIPETIRQG